MQLGFNLGLLMFTHKVTGRQLAKVSGLSEVAISELKNKKVLPEIGGRKIGLLANSLSEITGKTITPIDLVSNVNEPL